MKKKLLSGIIILAACVSCNAFDLKTALKEATSAVGQNTSTTDLVNGLGSFLESLTATENITVADITGVWKYSAPAVSFQSENVLKKAGGTAAATAIESKLQPYYKQAGIENMTLTIKEDQTFNMKLKRGSLNGTLEKDEKNKCFVFHFTLLGATVASSNAFVSKTATNSLTITFDASKLITILNTASTLSGNSTLQGVSSILSSYDGMRAGFKLRQ